MEESAGRPGVDENATGKGREGGAPGSEEGASKEREQ